MKINTENLENFWRYIAERHTIYSKKCLEKLPSPWTSDAILCEYKFTNVFRDLDPGTRYVIDVLVPKYLSFRQERSAVEKSLKRGLNNKGFLDFARNDNDCNIENLLFNLIIYRLYNKPTTSDAV